MLVHRSLLASVIPSLYVMSSEECVIMPSECYVSFSASVCFVYMLCPVLCPVHVMLLCYIQSYAKCMLCPLRNVILCPVF